ncbi:hypothetical protein HHI36_018238, partial [Cryptolaemus montrouzieri]
MSSCPNDPQGAENCRVKKLLAVLKQHLRQSYTNNRKNHNAQYIQEAENPTKAIWYLIEKEKL